jgi:hypothetical protein
MTIFVLSRSTTDKGFVAIGDFNFRLYFVCRIFTLVIFHLKGKGVEMKRGLIIFHPSP